MYGGQGSLERCQTHGLPCENGPHSDLEPMHESNLRTSTAKCGVHITWIREKMRNVLSQPKLTIRADLDKLEQ